LGLVLLSLSLIPQSRRVSELKYEALSPELKYKPPTSFAEFSMHFAKLIPFMWPKEGPDAWRLRACMVSSFAVMVLGRGANLLVPIQYKRVVDALGGLSGTGSMNFSLLSYISPTSFAPDLPYTDVLLFVALRFLAGSSGVLQSLQAFLWIPVGQYTTRQISVEMLRHLHNLSLGFHLNRKTGEILRVQDKAVASIVSLLSSIIFNILPTLSDIAIACFFFTFQFDAVFGTIVFITMGAYILSTIVITEWRTQYRKRANELDNAMEAKAVDSLLNFETVKYYNAEEFEVQGYNRGLFLDYFI
jgi:ATP-binding cassette subfamily B (MDR/TAP) protein 6